MRAIGGFLTLVVSGSISMSVHAVDKDEALGLAPPAEIALAGSDVMLQLGLKIQQAYKKVRPNVTLSVSGAGSGTGIRKLIQGESQLAATSRPMKEAEIARFKAEHGVAPVEHVVGYNVIGVFAHPENPLQALTLNQLKTIYSGPANWSVFVDGFDAEVKAVSRSSTSGTYAFFRDAVFGKGKRMGKGIATLAGSRQVVEFVATTPAAIGYSGITFKNDRVKVVPVRDAAGDSIAPNGENVRSGAYPLTRPLYVYSIPNGDEEVERLVAWIKSRAGQKLVEASYFTPIR